MRRQLSLSALPAVRPQSHYQSNDSHDQPRRHSNLRERYRAFHDEVFAYVMSQMWYDLMFVHIFPLRPRPYCCPVAQTAVEEVLLADVLQSCSEHDAKTFPCKDQTVFDDFRQYWFTVASALLLSYALL